MATKQDQTDEQILDKEGITITLAGVDVDLPQPNRRNRRQLYERVVRTLSSDDVSLIGMIDKMLDCLYEMFPPVAKHRAKIDAEATEEEIQSTFKAVAQWLGNPIESWLKKIMSEVNETSETQ